VPAKRHTATSLTVCATVLLATAGVAVGDEPQPPVSVPDTAEQYVPPALNNLPLADTVDGRDVIVVDGTPVVAGRVLVFTETQYMYNTMRPLLLAAGASDVLELGPKELLAETDSTPEAMKALAEAVAQLDHVTDVSYDELIPAAYGSEQQQQPFDWWMYLAASVAAATAVLVAGSAATRRKVHRTADGAISSSTGDDTADNMSSTTSTSGKRYGERAHSAAGVSENDFSLNAISSAASADVSDAGAS
jgi:hypothetical protein